MTRAITATTKAVTATWDALPTALVLQNPSTGPEKKQQNQAVDAVRALAVTARLPVIDVRSAFTSADSLQTLLADGVNPSPDGSRLWADTVEAALGVTPPASG